MNVLITGGTGFIGTVLVQHLLERGDTVTVYTRNPDFDDDVSLRYVTRLDDIAPSTYYDAFVNLAGESIAEGRWTAARKRALVDSRVKTTEQLLELAERLERPPSVLVSASAIGYYGPQDDTPLAEDGDTVDCFSHQLCVDWEAAAHRFEALGTRVCITRLGVVLDRGGGAFAQLDKSVMFGVATWLGSGRQWLSWVHRDDVVRAITFLLDTDSLSGAFNLTAPEPVTNRGFSEALAAHRSTLLGLPVPGFVMRAALGELAQELLLTGQRVVPTRLKEAGFSFEYRSVDQAISALLAR
ncbi:MAG: TIGR01777 family oxidoreductase [Halieaceae bacterium]|nr:TIGR01777 family oxidoreductase [Halieaceae bacterium]